MPRFDNEGFSPNKRIDNDSRDRSVPENENYYGSIADDFDYNLFNNNGEIRDNQINDNYEPLDVFSQKRTSQPNRPNFTPKVERDYDAEQRERNAQRTARRHAQLKKKKRKRKGITALIIILIILILPAILINGILGKIIYDEHKDNQYISASELKSDSAVKNILLLGVDAREGQDPEKTRPDTIMLVSVDTKHGCIKMTSFLRDTWIYIPSRGSEQRINASTAQNGYSGVVETIEYNFGIDIDGYVVTNFEMFKQMVDSIGGVEIKVTKKEAKEVTKHKKRYGNVKLKAGKQILTGEQALAYSRIRKIDTDFERTKRQRKVIQSIINEAKKNPLKLYSIANNCAPYIETDLTKQELMKIAAMATVCLGGEMPQDKVPFEGTWNYANKGGASVITIDVGKNKEILTDNIYNKSATELTAEKETKK